jgi:repressor LexA
VVNNGKIAAVIIEDESTLKRMYYYPDAGKLVLNAENPKYEPLVYVGDELNQIHILCKAIAFQSDVV